MSGAISRLASGMPEDLARFERSSREFFACKPSWRRLRGGR